MSLFMRGINMFRSVVRRDSTPKPNLNNSKDGSNNDSVELDLIVDDGQIPIIDSKKNKKNSERMKR